MGKALKSVMSFATVAFILLGVLFGMQIMTFIFGNLGPEASGLEVSNVAYNVSQAVQNNSLVAIRTYTSQSNTQLNTAAIAITLLILIAVFLIFWNIFIKGGGKGKGDSGGNFA